MSPPWNDRAFSVHSAKLVREVIQHGLPLNSLPFTIILSNVESIKVLLIVFAANFFINNPFKVWADSSFEFFRSRFFQDPGFDSIKQYLEVFPAFAAVSIGPAIYCRRILKKD